MYIYNIYMTYDINNLDKLDPRWDILLSNIFYDS